MDTLDPLLPVQLLLGDEPLLVERAEHDLLLAALPEGRSGFTFSAYPAGESIAAEATQVARTMPMMARRRVVLIREMEQAPLDLLQQLVDYLASPSPSTLLVLVGQKLPATEKKGLGTRLTEAVKKVGAVHRFSARDVRPETFVQELVRGARCSVDPAALRLLLEMVGGDLGQLKGEVEKLICYVGPAGTITPEAVAAACSLVAEAQTWDLTDALVRRNADRALAAMHRLLEDGKASHQLLAMVSWQFRQLLELQAARGGIPQSWARMPRQKVQDAQRLLRERPMPPDQILKALSAANHAFNRSRAGDRRVFEALILSLVAG